MFHQRGGSRKPSRDVRYPRNTRVTPHTHVLGIQAFGVLRAIGIHLEGADVTRSTVNLNSGEET